MIEFTVEKSLRSSAKSNALVNFSLDNMSFIKIKNNIGPRCDPWGTLELTLMSLDKIFLYELFVFD